MHLFIILFSVFQSSFMEGSDLIYWRLESFKHLKNKKDDDPLSGVLILINHCNVGHFCPINVITLIDVIHSNHKNLFIWKNYLTQILIFYPNASLPSSSAFCRKVNITIVQGRNIVLLFVSRTMIVKSIIIEILLLCFPSDKNLLKSKEPFSSLCISILERLPFHMHYILCIRNWCLWTPIKHLLFSIQDHWHFFNDQKMQFTEPVPRNKTPEFYQSLNPSLTL